MNKQIFTGLLLLSLVGLPAMAQQNVTIKPGDDYVSIIESVTEPGSVITFEAGYYKVSPTADNDGRPDFIRVPSEVTVRGAGSGMDPSKATIIDCGYTFDSAIKIDDNVFGIVVENITFLNAIDNVIEFDTGSIDNTFNNLWILKGNENVINMAGNSEAAFNFCVIGWSAGDSVRLADTSIGVFTNCDIFLASSDIVENPGTGEGIFRNCIFYAGPGANDLESTGPITVVNSLGWDPVDGDPPGVTPTSMGRLDVNGGGAYIDENSLGEDPLYVAPPGMGFTPSTMDLHLQEGSPALTVGSTSFNDQHEPTGNPTFAGSQGLFQGQVRVGNWSVF